MFEKASEIRAAQRAKMEERWTRRGREQGIKEGRQEGQQELASRMREAYERFGIEQDGVIVLPRTPEVEQFLFPSGEFNGRS